MIAFPDFWFLGPADFFLGENGFRFGTPQKTGSSFNFAKFEQAGSIRQASVSNTSLLRKRTGENERLLGGIRELSLTPAFNRREGEFAAKRRMKLEKA
jgi:hypothetical protein